ncbi:unnamed protein product [Periconia digitata]|uniref:Uncharacterized protein n=1 Tax=Periconia digitata TaxID=1303443 RepID=A0A9W4UIH2_9PLEO|nr:unnamed protein product [Periconia digitata]
MSRSGFNMATTTDGAAYNKLRRPEFLASPPTEFPSGRHSHIPMPTPESNKRKHDDADMTGDGSDGEIIEDEPKEKRIKHTETFQKPDQMGPPRVTRPVRENGMQSMFPGLDGDDASEDETMQQALAYLRSVRTEASAIPTLLVAPPEMEEDQEDRTMYDDGRGDHRAWYIDGTWVAVGNPDDQWSDSTSDMDPQEGYYKSLLGRYKKLQHQLVNADSAKIAALVQANPEKYADFMMPNRRDGWLYTFENEDPTPVLAHGLSETNFFWALEFSGESLSHHDTISKRKSCWIWTLLALAGDRGTLDYTKIGRIRELGRRAGQLSVRLREGARSDPHKENEDDEVEEWVVDGAGTDGEASVHGAEEEPAESSQFSTPKDNFQNDPVGDDNTDDSSSNDEGEISEDDEADKTNMSELEAARAKLLAQLGDRLVQTSVPPPPGFLRHKHQRKRCHDPDCHVVKRRLAAHARKLHTQNAAPALSASAAPGPPPPKPVFASRAEAEQYRQKMRETELQKLNAPSNSAASPPSVQPTAAVPSAPLPQDPLALAPSSKQDPPSSHVKASLPHNDNAQSHLNLDHEDAADPVDLNTRVTIDMILTIVAECYGQKDLLRYREPW